MIGVYIALISTASWALCSILFKKLGERLEPVGMTLIKSILSALFLFLIIIISKNNIIIQKEYILPLALSGIIGISIGDSLFFASLNRLSPIALSLILFVGPDLFSGLFGVIFLKEFPSIIVWIGILLTLIGLGFFIFPIEKQSVKEFKTTFKGILFAFLSLICTAYSMVLIKPVLNYVPVISATMYRMFFSGIALLLLAIFTKKLFLWKNTLNDRKYNIKLASTMVLATFGGFYLSLLALKYAKLVIVSSVMTLEPLFIFLFMVLFYKYKPKLKEYYGVLFVIVGIILICQE